MDRFEDLRTFVTLGQTGGFAATANRLGVVKSAVSRRVRELEERLNVRLIHRTSRRISLTEAGRLYLSQAEAIVRSVVALDESVSGNGSELAGLIRVTMPVSFATNCFAAVLVGFQKLYPRVAIDIDATDTVVDIVQEGFDLAIRIAQLKDTSLVARRVVGARHFVCASPAYLEAYGRPRTPEDLSSHFGIGYLNMEDDAYWSFRDGYVAKVPTLLRVTSGDVMREAAKAGGGVAYLPTFVIAKSVVEGSLEILLEEYARDPVPMNIVLPTSQYVPARVRALIDFFVSCYSDNPEWDRQIEMSRKTPFHSA